MIKRVFLLSVFFLFSQAVFANPNKNESNGFHSGPDRNVASPDRRMPRRAPMPRNFRERAESSGLRNAEQKRKEEASQNQMSPEIHAPDSEQDDAQKNNDPLQMQVKTDEFINYRGARVFISDEGLLLQNIQTERISDANVTIEITFNQSINPRSFDYTSIKIDGSPLPAKTTFSFNKKGDTVKLTIPTKKKDFTLEIRDIQSFSGTAITPIEIRGISDNSINEDIASKI